MRFKMLEGAIGAFCFLSLPACGGAGTGGGGSVKGADGVFAGETGIVVVSRWIRS